MRQQSNPILPNFQEETVGYTPEEAQAEASRCLNCKNPACVQGCPVGNNIPGFMKEIEQRNYQEAYRIISKASNLPAICGRVCAHERQCQNACILNRKGKPIKIGKLERFVADTEAHSEVFHSPPLHMHNKKVAIIGSGPAGLSAAGDLAREGYSVTVYEAEENVGGVLTLGIPEYRLPKNVVKREIEKLESLGIRFVTNIVIGEDLSIDDLFEQGFEAIFIASGAGSPRKLNIRGVALPGVMYANYFLATVNLVNLGKLRKEEIPIFPNDSVVVVGAGNVAMDAARTAKRLGAQKVIILYRRDYDSIPALKAEVAACEEEGINILCMTGLTKILGTTRVTGVQCSRLQVNPDSSSLEVVPGSEFNLNANRVILAIGQRPRSRIVSTSKDIHTNESGYVVTVEDRFGQTTRQGVFAGGDVVTTPKTVVSAMKQGKLIAKEIHQYLQKKEED